MSSTDLAVAGGFLVDPKGSTCTVTITTKAGANPTVYTDRTLGTTHTMPKKITTATYFILKNEDDYTISCKIGGVECATRAGSALTTRISGGIVSLAPSVSVDPSTQAGAGILLTAPNGTVYVVTVSNAGALVVATA